MYCIYKDGKGYTGQTRRSWARIIEHINYAYGLQDELGRWGGNIWNVTSSESPGLAQLIQTNSASHCLIRYATAKDCYGIGTTRFNEFSLHWLSESGDTAQAKIDFAEFCYIWNWRSSYAAYNTEVGGQRRFKFNSSEFCKKISEIKDASEELKKHIIDASKITSKYAFGWSGKKTEMDNIERINHFFWPEVKIFTEALKNYMYTITVTSDKIKSIIYYNLEQNCSKLPKKVTSTIQALSKTLNTLINEEVLDKTLKSAVNGIYNEIIASLEKEKEQWDQILEEFDLHLTINNNVKRAIKAEIQKALTATTPQNIEKTQSNIGNIPWSYLNLFAVKRKGNQQYPSWFPTNIALSSLGNNDETKIKEYYLTMFKKWFDEGLLSSDIKRKFTRESFLTQNWSEYYNGMYNKLHPGNLKALTSTEFIQYFKRDTWDNGRSSVSIELWPVMLNANGNLW